MAAWHRFVKDVFTLYWGVITSILIHMLHMKGSHLQDSPAHKKGVHTWASMSLLEDFPLHTLIHTQSVSPCENPIQVIISFSQKDILFEKPRSQTHHFICPYNFVLPQLTSVMSFYTPAEGEKVLTWTLVPWISCQQQESADAANCLRKKSQQRSEIKCRQLLLCFLELHPGFNISYLLPYLPYLFIDESDLPRAGFKASTT